MGNNFAGKNVCSLSYLGKIEKSFSPKLTDYFIQVVTKSIFWTVTINRFYLLN